MWGSELFGLGGWSAPKKTILELLLPWHVVSLKIFASADLKLNTKVAGVYVSKKITAQIAPILEPLTGSGCIMRCDFNAIAWNNDAANRSLGDSPRYDQSVGNLREARKTVEVLKEACVKSKFGDDYPLSRVRHYVGSRYIDWMYVCLMLLRIFQPMHVFTREVQLRKKKGGLQSIFIAVYFHFWEIGRKATDRCNGWGRKKNTTSYVHYDSTIWPNDVDQGLKWLNIAISRAFHDVQEPKGTTKAKVPLGWHQRIKKLASLARWKRIIFFPKAGADLVIPMNPSRVTSPVEKLTPVMSINNVLDCTIVD